MGALARGPPSGRLAGHQQQAGRWRPWRPAAAAGRALTFTPGAHLNSSARRPRPRPPVAPPTRRQRGVHTGRTKRLLHNHARRPARRHLVYVVASGAQLRAARPCAPRPQGARPGSDRRRRSDSPTRPAGWPARRAPPVWRPAKLGARGSPEVMHASRQGCRLALAIGGGGAARAHTTPRVAAIHLSPRLGAAFITRFGRAHATLCPAAKLAGRRDNRGPICKSCDTFWRDRIFFLSLSPSPSQIQSAALSVGWPPDDTEIPRYLGHQ